jgi:predicted RNA-binding Zn-ribbon protein involved in translation (DUF1610 family)
MFENTPFVCLDCRKSFRRHGNHQTNPCPGCGNELITLHSRFKVPRASDVKQWEKVRYLVQHGFRFRPIWDESAGKVVKYPATLREAIEWVEKWKSLAESRGGPTITGINIVGGRPGLTATQINARARAQRRRR